MSLSIVVGNKESGSSMEAASTVKIAALCVDPESILWSERVRQVEVPSSATCWVSELQRSGEAEDKDCLVPTVERGCP